MIPRNELDKAVSIARKYHVGKMYLVGSSLHKPPAEAGDYDFAVEGVPPRKFFRFYSELMMTLAKNVDLIDLSGKITKFKAIIMREGKLIYDKTAA